MGEGWENYKHPLLHAEAKKINSLILYIHGMASQDFFKSDCSSYSAFPSSTRGYLG